jgi:hypothetical protein
MNDTQTGTVVRDGREVTVPVTEIPQHNRPDGRWCRWSGARTAQPQGLCPDRCQAETEIPALYAHLRDDHGQVRILPGEATDPMFLHSLHRTVVSQNPGEVTSRCAEFPGGLPSPGPAGI